MAAARTVCFALVLSGAVSVQAWTGHLSVARHQFPGSARHQLRGCALSRGHRALTAHDDLQSLAEKLKQGLNSFKDFDDPEPETKRAKVQHYLDVTGSKDKAAAEATLEKYGYQVEAALKDGKTAVVANKRGGKKKKIAIGKAAVERGAQPSQAPASRSDFVCRVEASKNGRGGKTVTTVNGLELLPIEDKKTLLKALKNAVAGGGSISDSGGLEVQGEHAETVVKILKAQGFTNCKIAGGIPKKKRK